MFSHVFLQLVDALLHVMDPKDSGKISFIMFCRGIEGFLLGMSLLTAINSAFHYRALLSPNFQSFCQVCKSNPVNFEVVSSQF